MYRVVAQHGYYGCESGCEGHELTIYQNAIIVFEKFLFSHKDEDMDNVEYLQYLVNDVNFNLPIGAEVHWDVENSTILSYSDF